MMLHNVPGIRSVAVASEHGSFATLWNPYVAIFCLVYRPLIALFVNLTGWDSEQSWRNAKIDMALMAVLAGSVEVLLPAIRDG